MSEQSLFYGSPQVGWRTPDSLVWVMRGRTIDARYLAHDAVLT